MAAVLDITSYTDLPDADCHDRIVAAKAALAGRVVILGHHYQREEVYRHADLTGDSLKLAHLARETDAERIVFCGVHFMAEVADIMSRPDQTAVLPDMAAGCSMADMADLASVERAWRELGEVLDADAAITPVTYINSAANLKAFCGRHDGIVCTSTNAPAVLDWAFARRPKVLFFPDQHLGRNTAARMGIPLDDMVVWDPALPLGGLTPARIRAARVILWNGFCSVHQMFQAADVDRFREKYPDARVIAHPECSYDVCQRADLVGSTEFILRNVSESAPGTRWLVGTELNLVSRLHDQMKPKGVHVHFMSPIVCMCSTMYRIDPQHLLWTLESMVAGRVVNEIRVPEPVASQARTALERMLALA